MMSEQTVFERFSESAEKWPDKPFLNVLPETADIYGIGLGEITYGEMMERVLARKAALQEAGIGTATRVGLLLQNRPEFIEIWLATNALGGSIVPINPDLPRLSLNFRRAGSFSCHA